MNLRCVSRRLPGKFKLNLLLFLLLLIASLPVRPLFGADAKQKSPLWLLRSDKNTIYLMGSMHVLKKEAYPLKQALEDAYKASEVLVFETDLDAANSPDFQAKVLSLGIYSDGTTLEEHISKETFALVKNKAAGLGIPMEQVNQFKPWFYSLAFIQLEFMRLGFDPNLGVDRYFFNQAKQDHKKVQGLEPIDFQLQLLTQLGKENEEAFLKQTFQDLDLFTVKADQLYTTWRDGDTDALTVFMNDEFRGYPELYNRLFLARNRDWLPKIEKLIAQKTNALVIVGYGHLIGSQGLVQMLVDKGYQIEQQ
jgi:hypothetical protein